MKTAKLANGSMIQFSDSMPDEDIAKLVKELMVKEKKGETIDSDSVSSLLEGMHRGIDKNIDEMFNFKKTDHYGPAIEKQIAEAKTANEANMKNTAEIGSAITKELSSLADVVGKQTDIVSKQIKGTNVNDQLNNLINAIKHNSAIVEKSNVAVIAAIKDFQEANVKAMTDVAMATRANTETLGELVKATREGRDLVYDKKTGKIKGIK